MTHTIDKPHTLILTGEGEEREWEILHPATCPWEAAKFADTFSDPDAKPHWYFNRNCVAQYEIDANGIDSLDCYHLLTEEQKAIPWVERGPDWRHIPEGRYSIQCWYEWSGSMYDDADGGMSMVEFVTEAAE